MAWQPIETAPQDTLILVRGPFGTALVVGRPYGWYAEHEGDSVWDGSDYLARVLVAHAPTEWHPIPE